MRTVRVLWALASAVFALGDWSGLATGAANAVEHNELGVLGGAALVLFELGAIAAVLRIHRQAERRAGRVLGGG